jgi:hypothetical protein
MARIPLGNFGFDAPRAAPGADTSAVGEAVQGLGQAGTQIGLDLLAEERAKALKRALEYQNQVDALAADYAERIESGAIEPADAERAFADELGKISAPEYHGFGRKTAANVNGMIEVAQANARLRIGVAVKGARFASTVRHGASANEQLKISATIPGADLHGVLMKGDLLREGARVAGVPQDLRDRWGRDLQQAVAAADATRDPQAALAKLATASSGDRTYDGLDYESRQRVQEHAKSQLVNQGVAGVMGAFEQEGPDAGMRALVEAESAIADPELRDDLRTQVNSQIGQLRTQRQVERANDIVKLKSALATNSAGRESRRLIDNLYKDGALSPSELASYHSEIDQDTMRRAEQDAAQQAIAESITAGIPLDPSNEHHKKFLGQSFAADLEGMRTINAEKAALGLPALELPKPGSPEWQVLALSRAGQARMLPPQASSWLRSAARSPDPNLAAGAANFYGSLELTSPEAAGNVDQDTRAFLSQLSGMIEAGAAPEKAFETARANVFETRRDVLELRIDAYREHAKGNDAALGDLIDRDFDPSVFTSQPEPSIFVRADFDKQTEAYFTKVGDIDLARDLAWGDLRRIYGTTEVNGSPMLSAFPVEHFGITPEDVRRDVDAFLKSTGQKVNAEDVLVVPDGLTLRAVNDALTGKPVMPSYRLVTKSGDLVLGPDGVPQRFTLPGGEELTKRVKAEQAEREREAQAAMQAARELRERRAQQLDRALEFGRGMLTE